MGAPQFGIMGLRPYVIPVWEAIRQEVREYLAIVQLKLNMQVFFSFTMQVFHPVADNVEVGVASS